jgi:hypothetical protein
MPRAAVPTVFKDHHRPSRFEKRFRGESILVTDNGNTAKPWPSWIIWDGINACLIGERDMWFQVGTAYGVLKGYLISASDNPDIL